VTVAARVAVVSLAALVVVPSVAYALAPTGTAATHLPPRPGNWQLRNTYHIVVAATARVNPARTRLGHLSVTPKKGSGCPRRKLTVAGRFQIRSGGYPGYYWYVGDPVDDQAPLDVTVQRGGRSLAGQIYYEFSGPGKGQGNLRIPNQCDLWFGIVAPPRK